MFAPGWLVEVISTALSGGGFLAMAIGIVGISVIPKRGVAVVVTACRIALFVTLFVVGIGLFALAVMVSCPDCAWD